jgi:hypothetical protein
VKEVSLTSCEEKRARLRWLKKREEAVEMKVTWKNTKKKKPSLPPLSHFTDLPFEHDNDRNNHTPENSDSDGRTVHSPNSDQSTQLAMQFQAQGDKLAMVLSFNTIITNVFVLFFMFCFSFFVGNRNLYRILN